MEEFITWTFTLVFFVLTTQLLVLVLWSIFFNRQFVFILLHSRFKMLRSQLWSLLSKHYLPLDICLLIFSQWLSFIILFWVLANLFAVNLNLVSIAFCAPLQEESLGPSGIDLSPVWSGSSSSSSDSAASEEEQLINSVVVPAGWTLEKFDLQRPNDHLIYYIPSNVTALVAPNMLDSDLEGPTDLFDVGSLLTVNDNIDDWCPPCIEHLDSLRGEPCYNLTFVNGKAFSSKWLARYILGLVSEPVTRAVSLEMTEESAARLFVSFELFHKCIGRYRKDFYEWVLTQPDVILRPMEHYDRSPPSINYGASLYYNDQYICSSRRRRRHFDSRADHPESVNHDYQLSHPDFSVEDQSSFFKELILNYPKIRQFYSMVYCYGQLDLTRSNCYMIHKYGHPNVFDERQCSLGSGSTISSVLRDQLFAILLSYYKHLVSSAPCNSMGEYSRVLSVFMNRMPASMLYLKVNLECPDLVSTLDANSMFRYGTSDGWAKPPEDSANATQIRDFDTLIADSCLSEDSDDAVAGGSFASVRPR